MQMYTPRTKLNFTFDNIDWRLRFNLLIINYNSAARNAAAGTFLKGVTFCGIFFLYHWQLCFLVLHPLELQFFSTTSPSKRCSGVFNQCISAASNKHSFRQAPSSILIGRVLFCLPLCPLHCKQLPKAVCQIKDISRQCNLSIITSAEFLI